MNGPVRVRVVRLTSDADLRMLSVDELRRAERIRGEAARRRFTGVRAALRMWLGELTGEDPRSLVIELDAGGKPRLADAGHAGELRFSVTHSHELGAIAVAFGRGVGIDVEHVRERPRLGAIARRVLGEHEAALLERASDPLRAFYEVWTRHEALAKALGSGLPLPEPAPRGFRVENLELAPGYAAALAVEEATGR